MVCPRDKSYSLADGGGLYIEIMPTGSKIWRMKFWWADCRELRLTFGPYPEVTLAAAPRPGKSAWLCAGCCLEGLIRLSIKTMRSVSRLKEHPIPSKRRARMAPRQGSHLERAYRDKHTLRQFELDVFPEIGRRPIDEIKHRELITALRKIEVWGADEVAHRLKAGCTQVCSDEIQSGLLEHNIAVDIKGCLEVGSGRTLCAYQHE